MCQHEANDHAREHTLKSQTFVGQFLFCIWLVWNFGTIEVYSLESRSVLRLAQRFGDFPKTTMLNTSQNDNVLSPARQPVDMSEAFSVYRFIGVWQQDSFFSLYLFAIGLALAYLVLFIFMGQVGRGSQWGASFLSTLGKSYVVVRTLFLSPLYSSPSLWVVYC